MIPSTTRGWFQFQQARLNFAANGTAVTVFTLIAVTLLAFILASSDATWLSVTLPVLGVLASTALALVFHPWLKSLDLPRRDRYVVFGACLVANAFPPLTASFAQVAPVLVFWSLCCLGLLAWLMWFMGGRPPIRAEVDAQLAYGEGLVEECKSIIEQIERERPTTDAQKEREAELEKIKKERDERLTVLEEAMRDSDEPLDPVTASAQFQQIQTDYREALGRLSS